MPGEDLAFYKSATISWGRVLWLYMPIDPGDSISEIWKRSAQLDKDFALVFKTTQGRIHLFGTQPKVDWGWKWTLLDKPNTRPSVISFDKADYGIHELAFETPQPLQDSPDPMLPEVMSPFPESTSLQDYFYSSARLDNVFEVVVSAQDYPEERIHGLIFRYIDGREAHVGDIRLDSLSPPISRPEKMWLGFVCTDDGVFVRCIKFSKPQDASAVDWFEVTFCSQLEWWFSLKQCKVYYRSHASPVPRL